MLARRVLTCGLIQTAVWEIGRLCPVLPQSAWDGPRGRRCAPAVADAQGRGVVGVHDGGREKAEPAVAGLVAASTEEGLSVTRRRLQLGQFLSLRSLMTQAGLPPTMVRGGTSLSRPHPRRPVLR
jgi:hypothetical protein